MPFVIKTNKVRSIFLHCSASEYGDVLLIDKWHRRMGFSKVGYHVIILNGKPYNSTDYFDYLDGQIQPGRPIDTDLNFTPKEYGAHVIGRNHDSLGVCLVGKTSFTDMQLENAKSLCINYKWHYDLETKDIRGHYEDPNTDKTCPNIWMPDFREFVDGGIELYTLQERIKVHIKKIYG